jgi:hypothetical protein
MKLRSLLVIAALGFALLPAFVVAAEAPVEWDGLRRVASKRMDLVYVQPSADFRGYSKVIVEPTELAFHKNWRRDYNASSGSLSQRVSEQELADTISKGVAAASDIFVKSWREGGYEVVTVPGPDVLKVRTAVVNISVSAPDRQTSSRSNSFSNEAGHGSKGLPHWSASRPSRRPGDRRRFNSRLWHEREQSRRFSRYGHVLGKGRGARLGRTEGAVTRQLNRLAFPILERR